MSSALQRRIEQLEQRSPAKSNQLKVVMGYMQHLPPEYQGPRHLVVRDRLARNGLGAASKTSGRRLRGQRRTTAKRISQTFCVSS